MSLNPCLHIYIGAQDLTCDIPEHFLAACGGNRAKAAKRWAATLQWRDEHEVDTILSQPNITIETIRKFYPHFLHGRGLKGELIMYEMAGKARTGARMGCRLPLHHRILMMYVCMDVHRADGYDWT